MLNQPSPKPNPFPLFYNIFFFYHLFFGKTRRLPTSLLPFRCAFHYIFRADNDEGSPLCSSVYRYVPLLLLSPSLLLYTFFIHNLSKTNKVQAQAQAHTHFCCSCGVRKLTAFRAAWTPIMFNLLYAHLYGIPTRAPLADAPASPLSSHTSSSSTSSHITWLPCPSPLQLQTGCLHSPRQELHHPPSCRRGQPNLVQEADICSKGFMFNSSPAPTQSP